MKLDVVLFNIIRPIRTVARHMGLTRIVKLVMNYEYRLSKEKVELSTRKRPIICDFIEKYLRNGVILDLGCGRGIIAHYLDPERYSKYIGVDISEEAIRYCRELEDFENDTTRSRKWDFQVGDIKDFDVDAEMDIILFRNSLDYINLNQIKLTLSRLINRLKNEGVFIVVLPRKRRSKIIYEIIRKKYCVAEYEKYLNAMVIIFKKGK